MLCLKVSQPCIKGPYSKKILTQILCISRWASSVSVPVLKQDFAQLPLSQAIVIIILMPQMLFFFFFFPAC